MTTDSSADHGLDHNVSDPGITLLVLGGTSWLGGEVARQALARGHAVTCLARGSSGSAPEGAAFLPADRWEPGAYDAVAGRRWDAVVEVSWQPELVRGAVAALAGSGAHWVYVSSASVYDDDTVPGADEGASIHEPWAGRGSAAIEEYGPAKVASERAVLDGVGGDRCLVARAGLIGGYGDLSDRFGYWPARIARDDGPVLVPPATTLTQIIDVADLARWAVDASVARTSGIYNASGDTVPLGEVLDAARAAAGTDPEVVEVSDAFLEAEQVEPWAGPESLPVWLPPATYAGFMRRSNAAAKAAGLVLRPVGDTVADALAWERELGLDRDRRAGLTPGREAELIAAWRERLAGGA